MSSGNAKDLRKATKAAVNDILPELLRTEAFKGLYEALQDQMRKELSVIAKDVSASLEKIDQRSKDVQQYLLNEATRKDTKHTDGGF